MPSRWLSLAILLFWLGVMGPLLVRQAKEQLQVDSQPPGWTIDLVDEAQKAPANVHWMTNHWNWTNEQDDWWQRRYRWPYRTVTLTSVNFNPSADVFELRVRLSGDKYQSGDKTSPNVTYLTMDEGAHFVSREGQLQKTHFQFQLTKAYHWRLTELKAFHWDLLQETQGVYDGEVVDGSLHSTLKVTSLGEEVDLPIAPVSLSNKGAIFNPLHPVNRISDREFGQQWTVPLVDPVSDVLDALAGKERSQAPRILTAHVLPETRGLEFQHRVLSCLVIEYTLDGRYVARTWIEQKSGLVMKQESVHDGHTWEFVRDSAIDAQ